jgi:uncharacterized protein YjbJ (UPF0337 family)
MRPGTEIEVARKDHAVKSEIKEKVGHVTNDPRLEGKRADEKIAGRIQSKICPVQKVVEKP